MLSLRTEKTGYVVTLDLSKEEHKQIWYGLNDLEHFLRSSRLSLKDVYVSLNGFKHGSRKTADLRQIRNIGVDLDFYKLGLTREHVMEELNRLIAKGAIPCPNVTLYGRGMQLIYSISGGSTCHGVQSTIHNKSFYQSINASRRRWSVF